MKTASGRHRLGSAGQQYRLRNKRRAFWPYRSGFTRRRREGQRYSEGLKNSKGFAELTCFLAFFEIDDEAQSGACGQSQILLGDTKPVAGIPNQCTDLEGSVFQGRSARLPHGNIIRLGGRKSRNYSLTVTINYICCEIELNIPEREYSNNSQATPSH
jgi:hypothetical protein